MTRRPIPIDNRYTLPTVFTTAREIARVFFAGRVCATCGKVIALPDGLEPGPALTSRDGVAKLWYEHSITELTEAVLCSTALCAGCYEEHAHSHRAPKVSAPRRILAIAWNRTARSDARGERASGRSPQPAV